MFFYQNWFDIYPTYLGRTQQLLNREVIRRVLAMASAFLVAAARAAPNDVDAGHHSCADDGPNRRISENPQPLRLLSSAAPL